MIRSADQNITEYQFSMIRPMDETDTWNRELKIVFMLQGNGWLHMEDAEKPYAIRREDIFAVNSFQMYSILLEQDALAIALSISPSFLALFSPETENPNINCRSFLYGEDKQQPFDVLRRDFARAFRAQYKNESELPVHLRSKMGVLLDNLLCHFWESDPAAHSESGRERLRTAVDYIHRHYRENVTLGDLSAHTYLSGPYISRSFQKYLGISFTGYLTRVRLLHAAALLYGEGTVTEIAYDSGFPSVNALIDAFKQYNGVTPGQYRRSILESRAKRPVSCPVQTEEGFSTAFASLMKYAEQTDIAPVSSAAVVCEVTADVNVVKRTLSHTWKRMVNAGYARDVLNSSLQGQIRSLLKSVPFQYIRCKGVLDDDMMLYTKDMYGKPSFNFVYLDKVIDFILSTGARPMLELGHMPAVLAARTPLLFRRSAIISPPADPDEWHHLIKRVMEHLSERYGSAEVRRWLFSPWIAADLGSLGLYTPEEYRLSYLASYRAIKETDAGFRVCGPACSINSPRLLKQFLTMCAQENCLPDILTLRSFASIEPDEEKNGLKLAPSNEAFYVAVSGDEAYLAHSLRKMAAAAETEGAGHLPILLDEWSNNVWQRDLCNDTSYKSAYLFKNIMENSDRFYGLGYFSVGDQLDELAPAAEEFHGGFGLYTISGIPKSACRAMELLGRAGNRLAASGDGYWITVSEDEVQIYLHNYCHYDLLYRYRNTTNLTKTERYKVFNEKPPRSYYIHLEGLLPGPHAVKRYGIGPDGGSAYDAWLAMGAPDRMNPQEEEYLLRQSFPRYRREQVTATDSLQIKAWLRPHEIQLITISK